MSLVGRFEHLPNRPKSDEARPLLEKIASQVKPIMSKRGWKVGTLAEFVPSNPALLGLNQGAGHRINLRLRPPGAENTFYEYDQLVLVMLHELTHNTHGPHDAKFYKLLGEVEEEYYDLKRKGYSGEGFHSSGHHLNGISVPEYHGRARGLAAAEKRLAQQRVIGRGGVLGGKRVEGKSMKELVAEAAERRLRDGKSCKAGISPEVEAEVKKAQEESVGIDAVDLGNTASATVDADGREGAVTNNDLQDRHDAAAPTRSVNARQGTAEVIDLTGAEDGEELHTTTNTVDGNGETPREGPTPIPPSRTRSEVPNEKASARNVRPDDVVTRRVAPSKRTRPLSSPSTITVAADPGTRGKPNTWTCDVCTLINPPAASSCEACTSPRPGHLDGPAPPVGHAGGAGEGIWTEEGWFCEFCAAGPRDKEYWSCAECGWVRKWG